MREVNEHYTSKPWIWWVGWGLFWPTLWFSFWRLIFLLWAWWRDWPAGSYTP